MNPEREAILSRVRGALAPLRERAPLPDFDAGLVLTRAARGVVDLWPLFCERLKAVNGIAMDRVGQLSACLRDGKWTHGYCDPALWPGLAPLLGEGFEVETAFDRARVDDYQFGITRAAGAVAETGTIILTDRGTSDRLAALAPWVHVAVFKRAEIFADLPHAVSALGDDPNIIWVTGPSKTADVEGILIEGVHGPGVQIGLMLD